MGERSWNGFSNFYPRQYFKVAAYFICLIVPLQRVHGRRRDELWRRAPLLPQLSTSPRVWTAQPPAKNSFAAKEQSLRGLHVGLGTYDPKCSLRRTEQCLVVAAAPCSWLRQPFLQGRTFPPVRVRSGFSNPDLIHRIKKKEK